MGEARGGLAGSRECICTSALHEMKSHRLQRNPEGLSQHLLFYTGKVKVSAYHKPTDLNVPQTVTAIRPIYLWILQKQRNICPYLEENKMKSRIYICF
jgi:hypothetical protein